MRIQYISDLHLEFRGTNFKNLFKPSAEVLCMAGDICCVADIQDFKIFVEFLKFICPKFLHVIHVAGNHEYYATGVKVNVQHTMKAVNQKLAKLSKIFPNYSYLDCQTKILTINDKKYAFIGATMWTTIDKKNMNDVQQTMNDYRHIFVQKNNRIVPFTVNDMQILHKKHVGFIKRMIKLLKQNKNINCVLVTHHKPIGDTKNPDILTQAYETNITQYIELPIKLAIHGHTHKHYDRTIQGIRYVSNPLGYPKQHTKFVNNLIINI